MKKLILTVASFAALCFTSSADAQVIKGFYKQPYKSRNNETFSKGTGILSLGLGIPSDRYFFDAKSPSIYAKFEYGIMDEVGIGVIGGLGFGKNYYNDKAAINSLVGVVGYYHFNKFIPIKKLDAYVGTGFGLSLNNAYYSSKNDMRANIIFIGKIGARYYFTNNFGAYVESGYDNLSVANLGITFRF